MAIAVQAVEQLGIVCLFLLVFQPAAAATGIMTDASQRNEIGSTSAVQNVDLSQLTLIDFSDPQQLKKLFGSFQTQLHALQNRTHVLEAENKAVRAELRQVKKDKRALQNKTRTLESQNTALQRRVPVLENSTTTGEVYQDRRRAQDAQSTGGAENVHIFTRTISSAGHISGRVDESNGGHRLLTEEGGATGTSTDDCWDAAGGYTAVACCDLTHGPAGDESCWSGHYNFDFCCSSSSAATDATKGSDCSSAEITRQISAINVECCDEPDEDCSNGHVSTCNAGCGALIMPLWTSCRAQLGSAANVLQDAVTLCSPPDVSPTHMDAQMFMVTCPAGLPADDCIPLCEAQTHGFLLLLNIDGTDTTLTCSLSDLLHSWVGAAALGGFLGENVAAFVSAVISGAAGTYVLTMMEDADVGTDLVIQPGQNVIITGDAGLAEAPRWGSGGFTVGEMGSLSITNITVEGDIIVGNGTAIVSGGSVAFISSNVDVSLRTTLALNPQCYEPFNIVKDAWRATSSAVGNHGDCAGGNGCTDNCEQATSVGGGGWYRFMGTGGDALALSTPGAYHCGTAFTGWLSGWDASAHTCRTANDCPGWMPDASGGCSSECSSRSACDSGRCAPPNRYTTTGRYPAAAEGVVEMSVCFDGGRACAEHAVVGVVRCGSFLLWQLPYAPGCDRGYCTVASGL